MRHLSSQKESEHYTASRKGGRRSNDLVQKRRADGAESITAEL